MFECKYCKKSFSSLRGLQTHQGQYCDLAKHAKEKRKKYFCLFCKSGFETYNQLHGHKGQCRKWQGHIESVREKILTYDFLYNELIAKNESANHIAKELKSETIDVKAILRYAKNFGIKTKSVAESAQSPKTRDRFKETCQNKYGADNCLSKNTTAYKKRNKTVKTKYGVDNVFQLEDVKQKSKNTLFERYGVYNPIDLPFRKNNNGRKSKEHKIVEELLEQQGIKFESEVNSKFRKYNEEMKRHYSPIPDIFIEDKKIIIEINGDYWHANPTKYKPGDMIKRFKGFISAKEIWDKDLIRKRHLESFDNRVIYIWTSQIKRKEHKEILCRELGLKA